MNVAKDDGNKAGQAIVEFETPDDLRAAMMNDPKLAEQVYKDIEELEAEERKAKEASVKPPKTIDKPNDEKSTDSSNAGQKDAGNEPQKDDDELVTVKLPKALMGTYLKNRTADEAAVEMAKGYREKDRTIDFLKTTRRELEEKMAETVSELQKEAEKSAAATKAL
jgi:hypothetical protein